jgi:hypothetical protein
MEPMNSFISTHRNEFRAFLDTVCAVSSTSIPVNIPPSYSTPLAILSRLPPTSREGFPSLPYLIDHAKSFATLVNLWLEHCSNVEVEGELGKFHQLCLSLRRRTEECLVRAERAERPKSGNSFVWEEVIEQIESSSSVPTLADNASQRSSSITVPSLHQRGESTGKPSSISNRSATGPDSPLSMRGIRGPGRQLSLEILPTSRTFMRDIGRQSSHHAYDRSSPASTATSPYAGSEGLPEYDDSGRRSGTATPSSHPRNHNPYGHGYPKPFSFSNDGPRKEKRQEKNKEREGRKESSHGRSRGPGSRGWLLSEATPVDRVDSGESGGWTTERSYVDDSHAVKDSGSDLGRQHGRLPDGHDRHLLQERAARMEPGERRGSTPNLRGPRRDWAADERAKREERTMGISMAQASSSRPRNVPASRDTHSSPSNSGAEEEEDEETTALPRMTPQKDLSASKEKDRHLLERYIFKKRRG